MKINLTKGYNKETLISHIILECMTNAIEEQIVETNKKDKDTIVDAKLIVNDFELDIKKFTNEWESQVDRMIKEEALNLVNEKFSSIYNTVENMNNEVTNFQEKIKDHIKSSEEILQETMIETVITVVKSVNGMVWVGSGLGLMAIAYIIWLWRERF